MTLLRAAVPPRTHGEGLYPSPVAREKVRRPDIARQCIRCEYLAFVSSIPGVVSERDMIVPLINLKEVNSSLVRLDRDIVIGRIPRDGEEVLGAATHQIDGPYATVRIDEFMVTFSRKRALQS